MESSSIQKNCKKNKTKQNSDFYWEKGTKSRALSVTILLRMDV